ncbi:MAG: hypothetical protein OEX02_04595 [Cyclobacteriaceae bacterium]|nr:hypothetical protein [Cyclobacteriaceae bacterium]
MTALDSKNIILHSLGKMDKSQTVKVVRYIKRMLDKDQASSYQERRAKAMNEIREALSRL